VSHYGKIDPSRAIWDKAAACGRLLRVSESLPQSLLRHDEWYNEWLLKGGVCDILGTILYESPSRKMSIGLYRAIGDAGPFPRDAERLQALMPSLRDAARLHLGLIDIGYRSAIGRGRIDQLAVGAIFTDKDGRIIETNRAGEHILRAGDGLTVRNGRISARRGFETTKLARLIADAAAAGGSVPSAGCMLIARDDGHPPSSGSPISFASYRPSRSSAWSHPQPRPSSAQRRLAGRALRSVQATPLERSRGNRSI
jgi:hypothetical protein